MNFGIKGKTALVAGSSKGIGKAVALGLAEEGVNLVICARNKSALEALQQQIMDLYSVQVVPVCVNLSNKDEIQELFGIAKRHFSAIDILVTNTGGPKSGFFEEFSLDDWRQAMSQNFESVVELIRYAIPEMKKKGWGRIVNLSSVTVKNPIKDLVLSTCARTAVVALAKTLSFELASYGITVNNILTGYTETERLLELATAAAKIKSCDVETVLTSWKEAIASKRFAEPSEVAALVTFLSSQPAGYITGTSIPIDGGWTKDLL